MKNNDVKRYRPKPSKSHYTKNYQKNLVKKPKINSGFSQSGFKFRSFRMEHLKAVLLIGLIMGPVIYFSFFHSYDTNTIDLEHTINNFDDIAWSSYLGGNSTDAAFGMIQDPFGNLILCGYTRSQDFPIVKGYQTNISTDDDGYLVKLAANRQIIWSTYFGGSGMDRIIAITTDSIGNIYALGHTTSPDLAMLNATISEYDGSQDIFLFKMSPIGQLLWSTYFGGNATDFGYSITVSNDEYIFIVGETYSQDFPVKDAYSDTLSGLSDAFLSKFSVKGDLLWSTYLGGAGGDRALGVAVSEPEFCVYVTGFTYSKDFPIKNGQQTVLGGDSDAFVSAFSFAGLLKWSTYLGGNHTDYANAIAVNGSQMYITGITESKDFPQVPKSKSSDSMADTNSTNSFLTSMNSDGEILWSRLVGGNGSDYVYGISIDSASGDVFITGQTDVLDFLYPNKRTKKPPMLGEWACFVAQYDSSGDFIWGSSFGGRIRDTGKAVVFHHQTKTLYITGESHSKDFPIRDGFVVENAGRSPFLVAIVRDEPQRLPIPLPNLLLLIGLCVTLGGFSIGFLRHYVLNREEIEIRLKEKKERKKQLTELPF